MARVIYDTALYYRRPTKEELDMGAPKKMRYFLHVPVKEVFLGVSELCSAVLKKSVKGPDGLMYYFKCIKIWE